MFFVAEIVGFLSVYFFEVLYAIWAALIIVMAFFTCTNKQINKLIAFTSCVQERASTGESYS